MENRTVFLNDSLVNSSERPNFYKEYTAQEKETLFVYRTLVFVLGSVIVVSNLIVVVTSGLILKNGQQHKGCFMLLGNVSLADMLTGLLVILRVAVANAADSKGMCILQIGMIVSPTLVSIFSVGLIAVDRYIYILYGLYYQRWISTTRVRIGILLTWLIGLGLGFIPGFVGKTMQGRKCWYINFLPSELVCLISTIALLPILLVCILYSIILFHALRTVSQLQGANKQPTSKTGQEPQLRLNRGQSDNSITVRAETTTISQRFSSSSNSLSIHTISSSVESDLSTVSRAVSADTEAGKKKRNVMNRMRIPARRVKERNKEIGFNGKPNKLRAIKVVFLTTASFVCTWGPYLVASILYTFCDKNLEEERCRKIEIYLTSPLYILGLVNSVLNPMIYAWWHRGFKVAMKKVFCKT